MKKDSNLPKSVLDFFRRNGKIGGKQRAANLTAEQRSEQARKAVQARWAKRVKEPDEQTTDSQEEAK